MNFCADRAQHPTIRLYLFKKLLGKFSALCLDHGCRHLLRASNTYIMLLSYATTNFSLSGQHVIHRAIGRLSSDELSRGMHQYIDEFSGDASSSLNTSIISVCMKLMAKSPVFSKYCAKLKILSYFRNLFVIYCLEIIAAKSAT